MAYPNGEVPLSALVHLGANFWLPPGTAARWLWLVAEGKRRFGVTFRITPDRDGLGGWNAYRPLSAQILYRKHYGNMAAVPKFSSHGGYYQGREVFAIDVDNWSSVRWPNFQQLCAEAGFRTDFVIPTERWHIGDFNNPWVVPAFAGGGNSAPPTPKPTPPTDRSEMEMDDMDRLMLVDPQVDGNWYVVNYRRGTAVRIDNGFQLDRIREEVTAEAAMEIPTIKELGGPQPRTAITNLTIINPPRS